MGRKIIGQKYQDEQKQKESKKMTRAALAMLFLLFLLMVGIVAYTLLRDFDASGYTEAILNQTFYGKIEGVPEFVEEVTEEELMKQYEDGIRSFTENNIISGVEMDEVGKEQYVSLCKEIFSAMKFEVGEAERIGRKEYRVPVTYSDVNIFEIYTASLQTERERIQEKVNNGEYQGTEEEIQASMQEEFLTNAYTLLEEAYRTMEYGGKETMIFTVEENENEFFEIKTDEIAEFTAKIMGLDEIQD